MTEDARLVPGRCDRSGWPTGPAPQPPGERAWVEDPDVGVGHRDGPLGLEVLMTLLKDWRCTPSMAVSVPCGSGT
jgi:hypothetical protein